MKTFFALGLSALLMSEMIADAQIRGEPISSGKPAEVPTNSASIKTNAPVAIDSASGIEAVGFDKLAGYRLAVTPELEFASTNAAWADAQINAMIPTNILALNGRHVSIEGFMNPVEFEKGKTIEFMLLRDPPACCYATMPNLHEWVQVSVKSPGVPSRMYQIVRATGVLQVGVQRLNGTLSDVYRLDAESVIDVSSR